MKKNNKFVYSLYTLLVCAIFYLAFSFVFNKNSVELVNKEVNIALNSKYQIEIKDDKNYSKYEYISSDTKILEVSSTGLVTPKSGGTATITVKKGRSSDSVRVNISSDTIDLSKNQINLSVSQTYDLKKLINNYSSEKNYKFKTISNNIINVSDNGVVTGISKGNDNVFVSLNNGYSTTISITVVESNLDPENIIINKKNIKLRVGENTKLTTSFVPRNVNNKKITFLSSNPNVITVDSTGKITAKKVGKSTVTATTYNNKTSSIDVSVISALKKEKRNTVSEIKRIETDTTNIELNIGDSTFIKVFFVPNKVKSKKLKWSTNNKKVAVVTNGIVKGVKEGNAVITVKTENKKIVRINVKVNKKLVYPTSIQVNKKLLDLEIGKSEKINAKIYPEDANDKTIIWSSSDKTIADVNNGVITAKGVGKAIISAKTSNSFISLITVNVVSKIILPSKISMEKPNIDVNIGENKRISVSFEPSNVTNKNLTWSSSNTKIVNVKNGVITGIRKGSAVVTATSINGISARTTINVKEVYTKGIGLNYTSKNLNVGEVFKLNASITPENVSNKNISWSSSNTKILVVKDGVVTAKKAGSAIITAKSSNGKTATCKINVTEVAVENVILSKEELTLLAGDTEKIYTIISPVNASNKSVTWTSSNTKIAIVKNGVIKGVKEGSAIITAKSNNGKKASLEVKVSKGIVNPSGIKLNKKTGTLLSTQNLTLTATVFPSNATDKTVMWTSDDNDIAVVIDGKVYARKSGKTKIKAITSVNNKVAEFTLIVKPINVLLIGSNQTYLNPDNYPSVYDELVNIFKNAGYSANIKKSSVTLTSLYEKYSGKCINKCDKKDSIRNKALISARKVITGSKYDVVIFQEDPDVINKNVSYSKSVKALKSLVLKKSPKAKIYLRENYYYKKNLDNGLNSQKKINQNSLKAANANKLSLIRDGEAFIEYYNTYKSSDLYLDNINPSNKGSYLVAMCNFYTITKSKYFKTPYYGKLSKEDAVKIQDIVYKTCE